MLDVRQVAAEIVAREGGFVNDPDDPGGATKYGVTLGTLKRLHEDQNKDGVVDLSDLQKLTKAQAIDLFLRHYFHEPGLDKLPDGLKSSVFDMYVNAGSNAVKILQRLLNQMGQPVTVDGVLGPETYMACESAAALAPHHLADAYAIARRNYYFGLADKRPKSRKFARSRTGGKGGWIKRAEEFMSARYHMTQQEFAARVATWG